ncbi:MAG: tRNA epoxyqueuosine(34) reductase QueG [Marinilabiliaceae bacterium]|nr:tRNA epoxyqueuosine(34) reductase QueG [Marinilabiliaceae bacterium]
MNLTKTAIVNQITNKANELGFMAVGFSKAEFLQTDAKHLSNWLSKKFHAGMEYMTNNFDKRTNPAKLVEGTKCIISLIHNYYPNETPLNPDAPKIARYAYGRDYHIIIKKKLKILFQFIKEKLIPELEGRYFVDSAPVMEKTIAKQAGLGWIGKNSNLINPKFGSFFFISEIFINIDLPSSSPINDHCGNCTKCIDACPTSAIISPRIIDSNKCISYQTIENKNTIPPELKGLFNNWVFGCDICQEVCPWNNKSIPHNEPAFNPPKKLMKLTNEQWYQLNEISFNELFKGSAVNRTRFSGISRNLHFIRKN